MSLKPISPGQQAITHFGPARIFAYDGKSLKRIFLRLRVNPDHLHWKEEPNHPESVSVRIDGNDLQYGGHTFAFMKVQCRRYFFLDQFAWVVQISHENNRRESRWYFLRGRSALDFLWEEDAAGILRGLAKKEIFAQPTAGEVLQIIEQLGLIWQLNGWGVALCLVLAVLMCLVIR